MISISICLLCLSNSPQDSEASETGGEQARVLRGVAAEVSRDVAGIRGKPFRGPVQVKVAGRAAFLEYARERMNSLHGPERMGLDQQVARLAGLIPRGMDLEQVTLDVLQEQVGGFYEPTTDTFYVMDDLEPDLARLVMAHELAHALDDQYHDLDGTDVQLRSNSDALLAHHAVAEGSAQVVMGSWLQANLASLNLEALRKQQEALASDALQAAPPFVWKPLLGLYAQGQAFLERTAVLRTQLKSANFADLESVFQDLPQSTEQILHPNKYWDESTRDLPLHVQLDDTELAAGWKLALEDTFGELMLALVCEPLAQRGGMSTSPRALAALRYTNQAASGWGGDRYALLRKGEAEILYSVTAWDTDADGSEFLEAMESLQGELRSQVRAGDALFGFQVKRVSERRVDWMAWKSIDEALVSAVVESMKVRVSSGVARK